MKSSVIKEIVRHDLCIGCGLCAALCPQEALEMSWNRYGEYNPIETAPCITECGLCQKICPFGNHEENEDSIRKKLYGNVPGISYRPEVGDYLATYVGYAEKYRPISASGGIATWLLERLLEESIVDHIICVAPTGDPDRLFTFTVFDTPEDVRNGAGSAYYPVELSGVIRQVLEMPGRYAVTGLPCFIKAIRLAQQMNIKLQERIVVTIGLVCGQLKSKHFTEYIATFAGVRGKVTSVRYRGKSQNHPANNYHYAFITEYGEKYRIFWNEGIAEAWSNRWFTPNACNYCDDIFAECADVTCLDAWLPEYSKDSRGTSLILVRTPLVEEVFSQKNGIFLIHISIERIVQSQAQVLVLKRRHLAYRLFLDQLKGKSVPKKRIAPKRSRNPLLMREVVSKDCMSASSKEIWAGVKDGRHLREMMQPEMKRLEVGRQITKIIGFPLKTFLYIRRNVRRRPDK